ncbi:FAD binding domain-containing protein [Aspergillus avenaceus]|uniref:FAD binding domain-containing protein n=1 Tax=Aspergillus avenaceus TaxID=36643 RepID=A0A5N6U375_ASPAV|nr:FAD binding domain-containing protein [Aspergillus avenaceus]
MSKVCGARGCGLAFARGLAEAGANVAIFDIIEPDDAFHAITTECKVRTAYYKVNVSSEESLRDAFAKFQTDFDNALDICVPCAGINRHFPFLEFTYKDHLDLLSVNMIANGTKHGSIILVASMASHIAIRDQLCSVYCATKGAVRSMCPAIAKEMAAYFPHLEADWKSSVMNGRIADPEDIMGACVFLASDANNEGYSVNGSVDASTTVVVVGAGPSGLMLGCNLVRYGIEVVILDDRPDKTSTGKADGLQPKTIETLKQMRIADSLLKNAARVYDIAFWESTQDEPLKRTGRKTHYPDHLVGAADPYILLAHQGMLEDVMIEDMASRGVSVQRNSRFISCARVPGTGQLDITYEDTQTKSTKTIRTDYLVGCDGARSKVRTFIPDAYLEGEMTNASWGVLDGVIKTDFPDLWSKVAVRSHTAGSILWIPRERNMTRLYVELSSTDGERVDISKVTTEYVMQRARAAMHPYSLEWKTVEWFGNYVVGQRVARNFMDPDMRVFIAGDAGHCHSALAAQGANTSMHDSFNLAWKLNLVVRGLAKPNFLSTYAEERRKIANDLINFDVEHCKAFSQGEAALAKNFEDNIRFISGLGAEYSPGMLTEPSTVSRYLQPGMLQLPAKVTRYIDANPVDVQLDIPLLGQFRMYFFVPDIGAGKSFLEVVCAGSSTHLVRVSSLANNSYTDNPRGYTPSDEFQLFERYTAVSNIATYAMVTQSPREDFEIRDLPDTLQRSRWTLYLDSTASESCTTKWWGNLSKEEVGIAIVRPDGYIGGMKQWNAGEAEQALGWLENYFAFLV